MRRTDREITEFHKIIDIIDRSDVLRLGLTDKNAPYIVPVNFGYTVENETITFYFHSADEGRKGTLIAENPYVCFEMDRLIRIVEGNVPCNWSSDYESVIGYGTITRLTALDEQKAAMDTIMRKNGYKGALTYPDAIFSRMAMYKLTVEAISGKANTHT